MAAIKTKPPPSPPNSFVNAPSLGKQQTGKIASQPGCHLVWTCWLCLGCSCEFVSHVNMSIAESDTVMIRQLLTCDQIRHCSSGVLIAIREIAILAAAVFSNKIWSSAKNFVTVNDEGKVSIKIISYKIFYCLKCAICWALFKNIQAQISKYIK